MIHILALEHERNRAMMAHTPGPNVWIDSKCKIYRV